MNRFSLVASLLILVFSSNVYALLVGKVDVQKVLVTVKQGSKVRDQLKKSFDKKQIELTTEQSKIQKLQKDFEKQSLVMNDKAKSTKEREIQGKIMQLQQKSMGFQKEIQQLESKLKKPILDRIKDIITTVSESAKVDVTFEASTAPVIYAKNEKDLTDKVIKAYDEKYPK